MNEHPKGPSTPNVCTSCGKDHGAEARERLKTETPERAARRASLRKALELAFDEALAAVKNPFRETTPEGVDPNWHEGEMMHLLDISVDKEPSYLVQLGSEVGMAGVKTVLIRYTLQGKADPLHAMMSLVVGQAFQHVGTRWGMQ